MGTAIRNDERYGQFLLLLPAHKYKVTPAAIAAGFSPEYARCKQKVIMRNALRHKLERVQMLAEAANPSSKEIAQAMAEMVGFSPEEIGHNLKELATQDKDFSIRLKVVAPLARDYGIELTSNSAPAKTIPLLNITVIEKKN